MGPDVLEIGYESRYDQYDVQIEKPVPLVPRARRLTVPERIDIHGTALLPLDEQSVTALIPAIAELGTESVAIGFLHAYANPDHERRTRDLIADALPGLSISLSSEVCPEVREYERLTTTAANAYVRPAMARYLGRMRDQLTAQKFQCPVLLMTSGGGLTTLETAQRFPIRLVESGPAGGAILACQAAAEAGLDKVISFDMGGTTAKICLIEDHQPHKAREWQRPAAPHSGHRDGGDRRRWRLDRPARRAQPDHHRPRQRGRRSRPGRLRPWRRPADDHRRGYPARPDRSRTFRRRQADPRAGPFGSDD
jgi:N-methylhydantoinase A